MGDQLDIKKLVYDPNSLQDLLPLYYQRIFPVNLFHRWLSYGSDDVFAHREFSFTLNGDVYIRYLSFNDQTEFEKKLKKRNPEKIDIGAVYNQKPKGRSTTGEFQPRQKEFVTDIDLTDYDDIRTCCSGATVCSKCWKFIGVAVDILDSSLKVVKGGDQKSKKVDIPVDKAPGLDRVHPFLTNAVNRIDKHFEEICVEDQEIFDDDKNLEMLPLECKKAALASGDRWNNIQNYANANKKMNRMRHLLKELKLQFCYHRLDINVSKGFNHLLKAPFCVHPKTGQVCVPFDPKKEFQFKIKDVPNVTQLIHEIREYDKLHENAQGRKDHKKTSLAPNMIIFETFVKGLEAQTKKDKIKTEGVQCAIKSLTSF